MDKKNQFQSLYQLEQSKNIDIETWQSTPSFIDKEEIRIDFLRQNQNRNQNNILIQPEYQYLHQQYPSLSSPLSTSSASTEKTTVTAITAPTTNTDSNLNLNFRRAKSAEPALMINMNPLRDSTISSSYQTNSIFKNNQRKQSSSTVSSSIRYSPISPHFPGSFFRRILTILKNIPKSFILFLIFSACITLCITLNYRSVIHYLISVSQWIQDLGWRGLFICGSFVFITSFPFALGYSISVLFCGITFGFPLGFLPAYIGTLLGSFTSFFLIRKFFRYQVMKYIDNLTSGSDSKVSITRDILLHHPLKFLLVIRLCPLPFNIINLICSGLEVTTFHFLFATGLVQCKLLLHIYIGSALRSIAASSTSLHPELELVDGGGGISPVQWLQLSISIGLTLAFMVLSTIIYYKFKERWDEHQKLMEAGIIHEGEDILV